MTEPSGTAMCLHDWLPFGDGFRCSDCGDLDIAIPISIEVQRAMKVLRGE